MSTSIHPKEINIQSLLLRAIQWHKEEKLEEAETIYRRILTFSPDNANALNLLGLIEYKKKNLKNAAYFIGLAISKNNKNPDFHNNLGTVFKAMGQIGEAKKSYLTALELKPNSADITYNIAGLYMSIGDFEEAINFYYRTISNKKDYYQAYINLSAIYNQKKEFKNALECSQNGLKYSENDVALLNNMANALKGLERWEQSTEIYKKLILAAPDCIEGFINLGSLMQELGNSKEALHYYQKAVNLDPDNSEALNNLGTIYRALGRFEDAKKCYQKAIKNKPEAAFPYHNIGNIYFDQGQKEKAVNCLNKAIFNDPNLIEAYVSLGIVLHDLGKGEESVNILLKAVSLSPDYAKAYCYLVRMLQHECRWEELSCYNPILDDYTNKALKEDKKTAEVPFLNLSRHCNPELNYRVAKSWSDHIERQNRADRQLIQTMVSSKKKRQRLKINIGYLSNNFKNHPTAHLISGLFKYHNRCKFNIYCFSYGINDGSAYRKQIEQDCDQFFDIAKYSHVEAAQTICTNEIDILVDLVGHMKQNRLEITALRPAPLQVRWLGMAGTSGANFFDYIITDQIVTPEDQANYYSESFAYMPQTYQINNNKQIVSDMDINKDQIGLPENKFVYASFCSTYKIDFATFESWVSILKSVPDSVLWLLQPSDDAKQRLKKALHKNGLNSNRIIFSKKVERSIHLKRLGFADLCLDTFSVNGAATTSEALWTGVPVLTLKGKHFASRMAASILSAMELGELVTNSVKAYSDLAIKLALDKKYYRRMRHEVRSKLMSAPLFDTPKFVKDLENLYGQMWHLHISNEKNKIIRVAADVDKK